MRLKPLTRDPADFLEIEAKVFRLRRGGKIEGELTLEGAELRGDLIYAEFTEVPDRTAAERFTNCDLVIREEERWELPPGSYWFDDLPGLIVLDAESGDELGVVTAGREGPANDYLVLDLKAAAGKETLLPLIPRFVPEVDIAARRVRVLIPPGLLD